MMCYENGTETTEDLFREMHRLLKPGGRLIQISLHKEDEVRPFNDTEGCDFVCTTCKLVNMKLFDPNTSRKESTESSLSHTFAGEKGGELV
jgi:ubiquinone/menaquinone biosynthesis C-methylase UbiE